MKHWITLQQYSGHVLHIIQAILLRQIISQKRLFTNILHFIECSSYFETLGNHALTMFGNQCVLEQMFDNLELNILYYGKAKKIQISMKRLCMEHLIIS